MLGGRDIAGSADGPGGRGPRGGNRPGGEGSSGVPREQDGGGGDPSGFGVSRGVCAASPDASDPGCLETPLVFLLGWRERGTGLFPPPGATLRVLGGSCLDFSKPSDPPTGAFPAVFP